jgi:carbamoyl-phosphate synthase large subunit
VAVVRSLSAEGFEVFVGDVDPNAVGLYLVPRERRVSLPRGDAPGFADRVKEICSTLAVDVLIPTVDVELLPLSRSADQLEQRGTRTVIAATEAIDTCLDKFRLVRACARAAPVPRSALLDEAFAPDDWDYPVVAKPRTGSGGRGVVYVRGPEGLAPLTRDGSLLVQEYLPGEEYSVDVFADPTGVVRAAVPRVRLKVDSGVAVAARTVFDPELELLAPAVYASVGLTYVANVQFRRDAEGIPRLLEVNPRFPGTMPLTVEAGVPMPRLAVEAALGREGWPDTFPFREVAVVRHWNDVFVGPSELEAPGWDGRQRSKVLEGVE